MMMKMVISQNIIWMQVKMKRNPQKAGVVPSRTPLDLHYPPLLIPVQGPDPGPEVLLLPDPGRVPAPEVNLDHPGQSQVLDRAGGLHLHGRDHAQVHNHQLPLKEAKNEVAPDHHPPVAAKKLDVLTQDLCPQKGAVDRLLDPPPQAHVQVLNRNNSLASTIFKSSVISGKCMKTYFKVISVLSKLT